MSTCASLPRLSDSGDAADLAIAARRGTFVESGFDDLLEEDDTSAAVAYVADGGYVRGAVAECIGASSWRTRRLDADDDNSGVACGVPPSAVTVSYTAPPSRASQQRLHAVDDAVATDGAAVAAAAAPAASDNAIHNNIANDDGDDACDLAPSAYLSLDAARWALEIMRMRRQVARSRAVLCAVSEDAIAQFAVACMLLEL